MIKPPRHVWIAGLTSYGPRILTAGVLVGVFALMAPRHGTLDTGHDGADTGANGVRLPDVSGLKDPVSVSGVLGRDRNIDAKDAVKLAAAAATGTIPGPAFAAYQRSATVLNAKGCKIDWELIAAIGMVESNHGRFGGSQLGTDGVATPPIIGPELNGQGDFAQVLDTDSGTYDHDTTYDRAVGPMQFLPGTWAVVKVDGDADGRTDPQDIDDAALATAVYLCAGGDDLSTMAGQRHAILRYNNSLSYVAAVIEVATKYRQGDFAGAAVGPGGTIGNFPGTDIPRPPIAPYEQPTQEGPVSTPPNGSTPTPHPGQTTPATPTPGGQNGSGSGSAPPTASGSPTPTSSPSKPAGGASSTAPAGQTPTTTPAQTGGSTPVTSPSPDPSGTTSPPATEPTPVGDLNATCSDDVQKTYPNADTETQNSAASDCVQHFSAAGAPTATAENIQSYVDGLAADHPEWNLAGTPSPAPTAADTGASAGNTTTDPATASTS